MKMKLDAPLAEQFPWATFGAGTYGGLVAVRWDDKTTLRVGSYTSFGPGVRVLCGGEHRVDWATTFPFPALWEEAKHILGHPVSRGDVEIGSDVWIGAEAMILSGVSIGHGAVIGARSLVRENVPPYAIVAGNPVRFLRARFSETIMPRLLEIAWWDWPRERIVRALPLLCQSRVQEFINAYARGEL